jgi:muramoyltetrapeptide carboxypeptidase
VSAIVHDRRSALQRLAAIAAALALPAPAFSKTRTRKPPRLRAGDTIGLVEPASLVADEFDLALVKEAIVAMGLVPKVAPNLLARHGYLAGTDEQRAADLNGMFADDDVRAIFAVRGGWGSARVLPHLRWDAIRANPKLLVGFSDITALHLAIAARAGFTTIHGPNAGSGWGELSLNSFRSIAFEGGTPLYETPAGTESRLVQRNGRIRTFRAGKASGPMIGGNLTVLSAMVGTPCFRASTERSYSSKIRMKPNTASTGC